VFEFLYDGLSKLAYLFVAWHSRNYFTRFAFFAACVSAR
jgi:hypothetical protein